MHIILFRSTTLSKNTFSYLDTRSFLIWYFSSLPCGEILCWFLSSKLMVVSLCWCCSARKKNAHTHTLSHIHTPSQTRSFSPSLRLIRWWLEVTSPFLSISLPLPSFMLVFPPSLPPSFLPSPLCFWTISLLSPLYLHCRAQYQPDRVDEGEIQSSWDKIAWRFCVRTWDAGFAN